MAPWPHLASPLSLSLWAHVLRTLQKWKIYALSTIIYFSLNKLETTPLEYINSFKTFETYTDLFNLK